jgi:hypothetical protein
MRASQTFTGAAVELSLLPGNPPLPPGEWTFMAWHEHDAFVQTSEPPGSVWIASMALTPEAYEDLVARTRVGETLSVRLSSKMPQQAVVLPAEWRGATMHVDGPVVYLRGHTVKRLNGFIDSRVGDVRERYNLEYNLECPASADDLERQIADQLQAMVRMLGGRSELMGRPTVEIAGRWNRGWGGNLPDETYRTWLARGLIDTRGYITEAGLEALLNALRALDE